MESCENFDQCGQSFRTVHREWRCNVVGKSWDLIGLGLCFRVVLVRGFNRSLVNACIAGILTLGCSGWGGRVDYLRQNMRRIRILLFACRHFKNTICSLDKA